MLNTVEIFFNDLNERGQKKLLEAAGVNEPKEMNWDIDMCPVAIYQVEREEN